jgi:UDP-N-acetylglucosamine 1-carboxyvinyltransferase
MGVKFSEGHGFIYAKTDQLKGADIHLDFPSVGTTENLMLAGVLAKGTTMIRNVAKEPEIVDLQNFLNRMGAHIKGAGTDTIKIEGCEISDLKPVKDYYNNSRQNCSRDISCSGGHYKRSYFADKCHY